jgi:DNA-binding GntR family transcriptional regulator
MAPADIIDIQRRGDRPTTLASAVHERLRRDIVSATLLPGDKLGMDALRARYNVGGSPLREALNRLVSEGLVRQEDQKGFRVAPVSIEELQELTHTRQLINEIALRESMRNGDAAWEEEIILAYHRMIRVPGERGKSPESERLHLEFHRALIVGCGSRQIIQMSQQLFDQAKRYQMLSISRAAPPRNGDEEHRQIMEAVLARDVERAVKLAHDHIGLTATIVLDMKALPALSENPGPLGGKALKAVGTRAAEDIS